jgi:glycosyltransferase involved in cell wall biosynthesis
MNRFVTAFAGRRDSYQVPLALAEAGLLDRFITDFYLPGAFAGLAARKGGVAGKMALRRCPQLPDERVHSQWTTAIFDALAGRLGLPARRRWAIEDRRLSRAAARRAAQAGSHLLLYKPYAWKAFTASYAHRPLKVLFHFHPHPQLEAEILAADAAAFPPPFGAWTSLDGGLPEEVSAGWRPHDSWRHADLILCASSFTRSSLVHAGADFEKCRIIPYGIENVAASETSPAPGAFDVLYVGAGRQRKGLHHLLMAWARADLPAEARLTLVCRDLDPQMRPLIDRAGPAVKLREGVGADELAALYARSHLFVLPSLVEGFGYVCLEALARGCPVAGTRHTSVADLGGESDGLFLVAPGAPGELSAFLKNMSSRRDDLLALRDAAKKCARRFTWERFRGKLAEAVTELLSQSRAPAGKKS